MSTAILIVDDSPQIRNMVRLWLDCDPRFRVCGEAGDGKEGIRKALELKPDVIVLDLSMPGMNGLETAALLQTAMPDTPIILFTLYADSELAHMARDSGVASVLSKMDQMSSLSEEIEKLARIH